MVGTPGRPRQFDRDAALDAALRTFWTYGYEATSISTLTTAMGIAAPSLYAAFGDKRSLFDEVVEHYRATYVEPPMRPLFAEPRGRDAIELTLRSLAHEYADASTPRGCLIASAATNCGPGSVGVQEQLREFRDDARRSFERRLRDAIAAGELPAGTDVRALARYFTMTVQGLAAQARDGASRKQLDTIVDLAMNAWPGS